MRRHHYLGFSRRVGESLRDVAEPRRRVVCPAWLACGGPQVPASRPFYRLAPAPAVSAPSPHRQPLPLSHPAPRPSSESRLAGLIPESQTPRCRLAGRARPSALAGRNLGRPPALSRGLLPAANWRSTRGYGQASNALYDPPPKWVLIYPFHPKAKELLCDPQLKDGRTPKMNSKASTKRSAPGADRPTARLPKGAGHPPCVSHGAHDRVGRSAGPKSLPPWGSLPLRSPRPSSRGSTRALIGNQPATRPPRGAHPQAGAAELRRRGPRPAPLPLAKSDPQRPSRPGRQDAQRGEMAPRSICSPPSCTSKRRSDRGGKRKPTKSPSSSACWSPWISRSPDRRRDALPAGNRPLPGRGRLPLYRQESKEHPRGHRGPGPR